MKNKSRLVAVIVVVLAALLCVWVKIRPSESTDNSSEQVSNPTRRQLDRPRLSDRSDNTSDSDAPSSDFKKITRVDPSQRESKIPAAKRPAHWKTDMPSTVPPIPPGASVTPPEVAVTVDGRRHVPVFQGSFSDRMEISAQGRAVFSVAWPPEHKTEEILVSTINDGRINGEAGTVLRKGSDGRFRFNFQAGPHTGATQIIMAAATLSYTVNFWVPTGNPNVDPPALR